MSQHSFPQWPEHRVYSRLCELTGRRIADCYAFWLPRVPSGRNCKKIEKLLELATIANSKDELEEA
jgi:hypothetical protein